MKLRSLCFAAGLLVAAGSLLAAPAVTANAVSSKPVYVPDYSHADQMLPDGIIAWDAVMKTTNAMDGQSFAQFTFNFTNITSGIVTILSVHPSCGCTTAELPPVPWMLMPGTNGQMNIKVNLEGKIGTIFKFITVTTDKGRKQLDLRINIVPQPQPKLTAAQRAAGIAMAKVDRQAVFKGDCATCHAKNVQGRYGKMLYDNVCAVCHEADPRATMVPDLHNLKVPTSEEFWRTWITSGKAGSLMPAFSTSQGGPLNDLQIASLAAYLNAVNPSRVPPPK